MASSAGSRWRLTAGRHTVGPVRRRHISSTTSLTSPPHRPHPPSSPASYSSDLLAAAASRTPPAPPEHTEESRYHGWPIRAQRHA